MREIRYGMDDLLRVMERLRDPEHGCPWDLRQDFHSIVPSTLEECYELAQAIEHADYPHVAEELGDVLFQVVFYARLGAEQGLFRFEDIVDTLVRKLLRRHPHVFADGDVEGVVTERAGIEAVQESWESIKRGERAAKAQTGILADVPVALPALPRAQKLQKRAGQVGLDWDGADAVLGKLQEEMAELREALDAGDRMATEAEMGDMLFTCVNLARHLGLDAEASLRRATGKFEDRFRAMESCAAQRGEELVALSPGELDVLWEAVKACAR